MYVVYLNVYKLAKIARLDPGLVPNNVKSGCGLYDGTCKENYHVLMYCYSPSVPCVYFFANTAFTILPTLAMY